MAMNKPLFDIDIPSMQVAVNSYKAGSGLAWSTLFPIKYTPYFDLKGLEGEDGIPVSADKVAFNTKAPKKTRKTIGSWSGKLGKIAVSREKDEMQINEYKDLQIKAAANTEDKATAQYLVDLVYNDVDFCNSAMDYRVEVDALRIGCYGKATYSSTIDGDCVTDDVINFNVPTANYKGASVAWGTSATADGLKDLADYQRFIAAQGLAKPKYAIMERSMYEKLCAQEKTAKKLFPLVSDVSVAASMVNLETINQYQTKNGYPQILVIDSYATIEAKDGTKSTIKPWDEDVVVLSPTIQLGWTYYKPVPNVENTDAMQTQASYYKLTRYSDLNPMVEVTMAEAYVQPALINRASLVFVDAAHTSWTK